MKIKLIFRFFIAGAVLLCMSDAPFPSFPYREQIEFVKSVSAYCEKTYGFPVQYVFSDEPSLTLYTIYVCPSDSLWPLDTYIYRFQVHSCTDKDEAESVVRYYRGAGYDVFMRSDLTSWSSVSPSSKYGVALVITPDFFTGFGMKGKSIDWSNPGVADMAEVLIHEALHQYVWSALSRSSFSIRGRMKEEALATVLGLVGSRGFLKEKAAEEKEDMSLPLKQAELYLRLTQMYCRGVKGFYEDESKNPSRRKDLTPEEAEIILDPTNNALLMLYKLYYNDYVEQYLEKIVKAERARETLQRLIRTLNE